MTQSPSETRPLADGAQRLVQEAVQKQQQGGHAQTCVNHWLLALLERHGAMAESLAG